MGRISSGTCCHCITLSFQLIFQDGSFKVPRPNVINRYANAYISSLNQHIPFLHLPTLDFDQLEVSQLMALCSIGALYCFERDHATKLHSIAVTLVMQVSQKQINVES